MKGSKDKKKYDDFCHSSSRHFDEMVASLNLPEQDLFPDLSGDFPLPEQPLLPLPPPPTPPPPPPAPPVETDLRHLHGEISFGELKNAALSLANKTSAVDLTWDYYLGQLNAGVNALQAQNVDTNCVFVLNSMNEHLRSELKSLRHCVYYAVLHAVHQREREERENQKRYDAAKSRARQRANKRQADTSVDDMLRSLKPLTLQQIRQTQDSPPVVVKVQPPPSPVFVKEKENQPLPKLTVKIKRKK